MSNKFSGLQFSNEDGEIIPPKKEAPKPTPKAQPQKKDVAPAKDKKPVTKKTDGLVAKPARTGENGKRVDRNRQSKANPGQRNFDRKNLPGKGSNRPKKEGSGPGNWGNPKDEARDAQKHVPVEENKPEGETPVVEPKAEETKPAEPVDDTISYDEFLKNKKSTKKEVEENIAQLRANIKKENLKPLHKEEPEGISFGKGSNVPKPKGRGAKKDSPDVELNVQIADRVNKFNRGGYKGNKNRKGNKVDITDENQFPGL